MEFESGNSTTNSEKCAENNNPQLFCLRWNNYQSNLTNVFQQLLHNESFVDVTLACEDGHSVKAHKMILSACSPYFQSLFSDHPCTHPIVIMRDIPSVQVQAIVDFMYKGEINVAHAEIAPLLKVAESLKIRGLADVSSEHLAPVDDALSPSEPRPRKRRRTSVETEGSYSSEKANSPASSSSSRSQDMPVPTPQDSGGRSSSTESQRHMPPPQSVPAPPATTPATPAQILPVSPNFDELDIKPGIAALIEEERSNMMQQNSWNREHLPSPTPVSSSDRYQLQVQEQYQRMWDKNHQLMHHFRFRERGPLKSWRPETMADAIMSVLKEGLSLSMAARKYDIPYPTFVLYANRVHNMLGPSADGATDLRPKGRGRPQRILLGLWPEDHIHSVIRAIVFRDPQHIIKDEFASQSRMADATMLFGGGSDGTISPTSQVAFMAALHQQMMAAAENFGYMGNHLGSAGTPHSSGGNATHHSAAGGGTPHGSGGGNHHNGGGSHHSSGGNHHSGSSHHHGSRDGSHHSGGSVHQSANAASNITPHRHNSSSNFPAAVPTNGPTLMNSTPRNSPPISPTTGLGIQNSMRMNGLSMYGKQNETYNCGVKGGDDDFPFQDDLETLVLKTSPPNHARSKDHHRPLPLIADSKLDLDSDSS